MAYLCTYTCHWSSSGSSAHRRIWLFWSNRIVLGIYFLWPLWQNENAGRLFGRLFLGTLCVFHGMDGGHNLKYCFKTVPPKIQLIDLPNNKLTSFWTDIVLAEHLEMAVSASAAQQKEACDQNYRYNSVSTLAAVKCIEFHQSFLGQFFGNFETNTYCRL